MSAFTNPDTHAANPPESWTVERIETWGKPLWELQANGEALDRFDTKKAALAAKASGFYFDHWHKTARWFAGESIPQWRPWAECKAEQERNAARWGTVPGYMR